MTAVSGDLFTIPKRINCFTFSHFRYKQYANSKAAIPIHEKNSLKDTY